MTNCTEIEQMLPEYTLGSLGEAETAGFTSHIDSCAACTTKVREAGDTLVNLARMVPRRTPPVRVKGRIFARIEQANRVEAERSHPWLELTRALGRRLARYPGMSLAVLFLVVAVAAGYWSSRSLQGLQDLRSDIEHRMESVAQQEHELREGLEQQHKLFQTIAEDPGVTVKRLSATMPTVPIAGDDFPTGMIVISAKENTATIAAMHLPQLPPNLVYHVWLIKQGGLEIKTATLTVDSTGAGQAEIVIDSPLEEFRAILITIDEAQDGSGSLGNSALRADL